MSYKNIFNTVLTGEKIKDWIWFHAHSNSPYSSLAKGMNKFFNLEDNKHYILEMHDDKPVVKNVEEEM